MTRVGISESGVTSSLPGSWVLVGCPAKIQPITLTAVKKLKTMILLSISLKSTPRNHDSRTAISWIILVANERREVEKIFLTFRKTRPNQQTIEFRYFRHFISSMHERALIRRIGLYHQRREWAQHIVHRWRGAISPESPPS